MGDHPVKVPPELVKQWWDDFRGGYSAFAEIINQPAQWGADQELEACCEWVSGYCPTWPDGTKPEAELRTARRPKPPTLAELGLAILSPPKGPTMLGTPEYRIIEPQAQVLRAALNRLAELEAQQ